MLKELIKLFIRTNGRNPNKLELLQLKFKAAQQSGKGKVLEFPRDRITDWRKPRPVSEGERLYLKKTGLDQGKVTDIKSTMSNADYGSLKDEWFGKIIANTDDDINTFLKRGIDASDERFKNLTPKQRKDFLDMVDYRLKHGNEKFMNNFTDAKGEFKLPEDLAGGGIAGMLGEPTYADENHRVPFKKGKKVLDLLTLIQSKFGKDAITTASKLERPLKSIEAESTKAAFDRLTNKINTQEALAKGAKKMRGPIKNVNQKSIFEPASSDATTWLQQEKFFDPKALDMFGKKVPKNWIAKEKKDAQKLIDDLGPLDVSPNHPNYRAMKAIRQSAKDRLESIKVTEALGGNITMHDWLRMNRKNINIDDYVIKPGVKKVDDELSGIKKIMIKDKESGKLYEKGSEIDKSIQLEKKAEKMLSKMSDAEIELRSEFPGISDDLIKNILADTNPQRIAEVKAAMKEAMIMQDKGMGVDEIINIFKKQGKKPTKHASGGLAGMLGE